jgi:hypothetical protein
MRAREVLEGELSSDRQNRHITTQITNLVPPNSIDDLTLYLNCECADAKCPERLEVPYDVYAEVKQDELSFLVAPKHYFPQLEKTLKRSKPFWVIRKRPGMLILADEDERDYRRYDGYNPA